MAAAGATRANAVIVANPLAALAVASSLTNADLEGGGVVQRARSAASAAATQAVLAKALRLGQTAPVHVNDAISHVPFSALSQSQRVVETLVPGAYTLGLGVFGRLIPPSHDLTHAMGPTAAGLGSARAITVTMGAAEVPGSGRSISTTTGRAGAADGHWLAASGAAEAAAEAGASVANRNIAWGASDGEKQHI